MTSSSSNELLLMFLDRSQLVMTIIGVIANIETSFVLFTNGQVSRDIYVNRIRLGSIRLILLVT